jgi:hypothetical protein
MSGGTAAKRWWDERSEGLRRRQPNAGKLSDTKKDD